MTTVLGLAGLVAALLVPLAAGSSSAATPAPLSYGCNGTGVQNPNFDGDSQEFAPSDCAVGLPDAAVAGQRAAGLVRVRQTVAGTVTLTRGSLGFSRSGAGDRFGHSVRTANLDGDRYTDLVIGAPGVSRSAGRVYVVFGSASGLGHGRASIELGNGRTRTGDALGSALAVLSVPATGTPARIGSRVDVWVGAPGARVSRQPGAGAVHHYSFTYTFAPTDGIYASGNPVVTSRIPLTQASAGVPGKAHAREAFGAALAAGSCGLVIGAPRDTISGKARAGSVTTVPHDARVTKRLWTQDSPGVAGTAETGDRFGSSLALTGDQRALAIGVPRENIGRAKDAGSVTILRAPTGCVQTRAKLTDQTFRQGLRGRLHIGKAESGDRFGTALAWINHKRPAALYVGAPGEDIGSRRDAGSVSVLGVTYRGCPRGEDVCAYKRNVNGAAAKPVAGELFGTTIRTVLLDDSGSADVAVGAPGFASGTGRLYAWSRYGANKVDLAWIAPVRGDRLGSA